MLLLDDEKIYAATAGEATAGYTVIEIPIYLRTVKIYFLGIHNATRKWGFTYVGFTKGTRIYSLGEKIDLTVGGGARFIDSNGFLVEKCNALQAVVYGVVAGDDLRFKYVYEEIGEEVK